MTRVMDRGMEKEKLCVVLRGDFPPTDSLIMRYLLLTNDEREFRKLSIEHAAAQRRPNLTVTAAPPTLPELFRQLKVA
jgi:hypothetical protein